MKRIVVIAFLFLLFIGVTCFAQPSPWTVQILGPATMTATAQTSAPIKLNGSSSTSVVGTSFASGTIMLKGTALTTVTFGVLGSSDNGVTYFPLNISSVLTPATQTTTVTATTNGLYQVSLAGLTHIEFVTSGTFTATSVQLTLSASPNAQVAGNSSGGGGSGTTSPISGALADYISVAGSGTTLKDISGNNNNGTFAALAPTWGVSGLTFAVGQGVSLPAALNTARTQIFAVYIQPLPLANGTLPSVGNYQTLLTASAGISADNVLYSYLTTGSFQGASFKFAPSTYANSTFGTSCSTLMSGFVIIARTTGTNASTDPDHYYVNGVECQSYNYKTASASFQSSVGNYYLGSPPTGTFSVTSGLTGTLYRSTFLSAESTASQISTYTAQIAASLQSLGVVVAPIPIPIGVPQLIGGIDSITYGFTLANPATQNWLANLSLANQPAYTITNIGIVGLYLAAADGSAPWREANLCKTSQGPAIEIIFGGTNDIFSGASTPAGAFASLASMVQKEKAAGCRVGVGTMLSRTGIDAAKDTYDALILSGWQQIGADFLVDFAANPNVGADGAAAGTPGTIGTVCPGTATTYFALDCIHPTAAGQLLLATAASNSLNYYFGNNLSTPHVVTTTTYQMVSGDGAITAAPTANAAYTMPDCTGPSGSTYTISNPQSAFTLTVIGGSNQPIDGLATAITIPSNSAVTLRDVANPKTVSGCHWAM